MLNTYIYIYHQLPPTCFGVCYTTFRETVALLAQKLHAYCNVAFYCCISFEQFIFGVPIVANKFATSKITILFEQVKQ